MPGAASTDTSKSASSPSATSAAEGATDTVGVSSLLITATLGETARSLPMPPQKLLAPAPAPAGKLAAGAARNSPSAPKSTENCSSASSAPSATAVISSVASTAPAPLKRTLGVSVPAFTSVTPELMPLPGLSDTVTSAAVNSPVLPCWAITSGTSTRSPAASGRALPLSRSDTVSSTARTPAEACSAMTPPP